MTNLRDIALDSKAWPFAEARKILDRLEKTGGGKGDVLFETGYGPSGLPHIGTFGEVARTTMVRHAFTTLSDLPTRLIAFSDDMDGLRKVPDNVPNQEMMAEHLGKPLTQVPDPFGTHPSFGEHNNARLQAFLDQFGFNYEFKSATDAYTAGEFDETLLKVLERYDAVINVILPTLGVERQATYSPFLPVCPKTGIVLQVPVIERNVEAGTIVYQDEDGTRVETPVTGGACKLQWKADWAMRWTALDVDYEMAGKDLIDSVRLSSRICQILGGTPPEGFSYELFLDDNGEKISKSRGNGISIDEWLRYANDESLALYMFQSPKKAKRLYFDVIPKAVDEYIAHLDKYHEQDEATRLQNPVWHIHGGQPPQEYVPVSFALLLNLVGAAHTEDPAALWGFISNYAPGATPENHPLLDELVGYACAYYADFVKPNKVFRAPDDKERAALEDLNAHLAQIDPATKGEDIQTEIYEIGKRHDFENLRDWFRALYETLLGQSQGPRMGSFIALYGVENSRALIADALTGKLSG
ncbi:MAG: lysine--tRNA ligase [Alphaproteobacteria bacterium]